MKLLRYLTILSLFLNCGSASADNWRDDNPNQPNGYAASMYRYHHGTPDDDGPHDGYRATEFRARNGLDGYLPPEKDDDDGWGSSDSGGGGGGGRWGCDGSGIGRHFRQGQAEGEAYWSQRMQNRLRASGTGGQFSGFGQNQNGMQTGRNFGGSGGAYGNGYSQTQGYQNTSSPVYGNGGYAGNQMPRFNMNNQLGPNTGNYQYSPGSYNNASINSTALKQALSERPIGTLLRNSQGGFNRIYTGQ